MTGLADRLKDQFGDIDIYLFDQVLRGRITRGMRILDAGCGNGRNLVLLLREGFDVTGVDERPDAIERTRELARRIAPALPEDRFRIEPVESMSQANASVDVVLSSAVLHFARDDSHWMAMVREMWRVLAPGGILFARLATTVGQTALRPVGGGRYVMPDGDVRYLVDHERLARVTIELGGSLLDPLRSSVVHERRSMGTWVVRKADGGAEPGDRATRVDHGTSMAAPGWRRG
jgi:tellurite methyltransferase